jgi:hypothetical protein
LQRDGAAETVDCQLVMAIVVMMPVDTYLNFLGRFPLLSPGYSILRNSMIEGMTTGDASVVEMLCETDEVKLLVEHANQFYPDAAPYLETARTDGESSSKSALKVEDTKSKKKDLLSPGRNQRTTLTLPV